MTAETSTPTLSDLDRRLLDILQGRFPLAARPFAQIAEMADTHEARCLDRISQLRGPWGVIRQISAIFDTTALGYESSLVAAAVDEDRLEVAAAIISRHPGVSHNYQRPGEFNLWYTLAVPPDTKLGLHGTIERLHELSGAKATRPLPTLKLYKIGVRFDMSGTGGKSAGHKKFTHADRLAAADHKLTQADRPIIAALQQDLPIEAEPFAAWARQAGCSVDELLAAAQGYIDRKQMRRFAAVLNHRAAGARSNVMAVWSAPEDQIDQFGEALAGFDEVSHCYRRPAYDDWPYNLYTMVHAADRDAALATLQRMRQATGLGEPKAMWSLREFKKVRVRYFTPETAAWESAYGA